MARETEHCEPRPATIRDLVDLEARILQAMKHVGEPTPDDRRAMERILARLKRSTERAEATDAERE